MDDPEYSVMVKQWKEGDKKLELKDARNFRAEQENNASSSASAHRTTRPPIGSLNSKSTMSTQHSAGGSSLNVTSAIRSSSKGRVGSAQGKSNRGLSP